MRFFVPLLAVLGIALGGQHRDASSRVGRWRLGARARSAAERHAGCEHRHKRGGRRLVGQPDLDRDRGVVAVLLILVLVVMAARGGGTTVTKG